MLPILKESVMSVLMNYVSRVTKEVAALPGKSIKLTFALMCAERNLAWLRNFVAAGGKGDVAPLDSALDRLWDHVSGQRVLTAAEADKLCKVIDAADLYQDDYEGPDDLSYMHDCCNILASCIAYTQEATDVKVLNAATLTYEIFSREIYDKRCSELVAKFGSDVLHISLGDPNLSKLDPELVEARRRIVRDDDEFYAHSDVVDEAIKQWADIAVLRSMSPRKPEDFKMVRDLATYKM
jgi:hypothetical protein